jgi:hypothetical protein
VLEFGFEIGALRRRSEVPERHGLAGTNTTLNFLIKIYSNAILWLKYASVLHALKSLSALYQV